MIPIMQRDLKCRDNGHIWIKQDVGYKCDYCKKKISDYLAYMIGAGKHVRKSKDKK